MSTADVEVRVRVAYGSFYSPICDLIRLLWFVSHQTRHTELSLHHKSGWRWRPETHTFHLPVGEMTITLHDVAIILGLRIHGPQVTDTCDFDVSSLCQELLGVISQPTELQGSVVLTRWLSL